MGERTSFGDWMRWRRRLLDLTREELAGRVGCASVSIRRIELGERRPSKQLAARLATALELGDEERAPFLIAARRELAAAQLPQPQRDRAAELRVIASGVERPGMAPLPGLSGAGGGRGRTNLTAPLTTLIGRGREVAELCALLQQEGVRLVTLTGPGGIGKTRMALRVGEELLGAFGDGVFLIELAPLHDPALVLPTIARALGRSENAAPLFDDLAAYLYDRRMLLLLDNVEHVLDAAPTLARLLAAASRLCILATSRATLGIPGEHEYIVPSLALPAAQHRATLEELRANPAVALFAMCARAARSTFELNGATAPVVGSICRRLEGLPLAIELAAASVGILSVEQLADRLDGGMRLLAAAHRTVPERHQTLEATLDWSYRLLGPQATAVLRRLSVFAGCWSLAAAEAVCAGEAIAPHEVLALLSELRSKSLISVQVRQGEARYRMLEMVRQYARGQLEASGEAAQAAANHLRYFAALVEEACPHLISAEQVPWFERLALELDNLRAAMDLALAQAKADPQPQAVIRALLMPASLERFWSPRGYSAEGAERIWSALALPADADPAVVRSRAAALNAVSVLEMLQGDYGKAAQAAEAARAFGEAHALPAIVFAALRNLGTIAVLQRDLERGDALLQQGLELGRALGPEAGHDCAWTLSVMGSAAYLVGDHTRASERFAECMHMLRALGDANFLALALRRLGQIALHNGEHWRAHERFQESLALNTSLDSPSGIAAALIGLAGVRLCEGRQPEAVRLLGQAQTVLAERGERLMAADRELQERLEQQVAAQSGEQKCAL